MGRGQSLLKSSLYRKQKIKQRMRRIKILIIKVSQDSLKTKLTKNITPTEIMLMILKTVFLFKFVSFSINLLKDVSFAIHLAKNGGCPVTPK